MITIAKMELKAAEFEARAATLREAIALMNGEARTVKLKRIGAVVGQAIKARAGGSNGVVHAYSEKVKHQRADTLRALAIVAKRGPMTAAAIVKACGVKPGWIGPMRSRGYLSGEKGGEYARTKKEFHV